MRAILTFIQNKDFNLNEIAEILKDFNMIKLKSDMFYNKIVEYVVAQNFLETESLDKQDESYFLLSIFILHGNLNNPAFF